MSDSSGPAGRAGVATGQPATAGAARGKGVHVEDAPAGQAQFRGSRAFATALRLSEHILLVKLNAMGSKQREQFLLERPMQVMFLLTFDVAPDIIER